MDKRKTVVDFEVLVDVFFFDSENDDHGVVPPKSGLLSLINDFEDGKWRYKKFQDFVWNNIAETALSYKERAALIDQSHTSLALAAKKLRLTDLTKNQEGQGSELAEIVLYGIMKHHYKALPVVPKIFYKQNSQDNAKGADSVHIVVESEKDFSIWFGEAKFYNSIEDERFYAIISSIENSLQTDKIKKENSILTNVSDLRECLKENVDLLNSIMEQLSPASSIDTLKPKLHIPILLLHECDITNAQAGLTDAYKDSIITLHKERAKVYYEKQAKKLSSSIHRYSEIHFHLILFPVPKKKPIIDSFVKNVKHYKDQ